jgi:hypothetical protein
MGRRDRRRWILAYRLDTDPAMGERLVVDPDRDSVLHLAARRDTVRRGAPTSG